jgi:hypothetical protein
MPVQESVMRTCVISTTAMAVRQRVDEAGKVVRGTAP